MKIEQIIKEQQPNVAKKLNKKRKRKRRGKKSDHLSFNDIERLMRENNGVDSTRCRGR